MSEFEAIRDQGRRIHQGFDFLVQAGTDIYPAMPGKVIFSGALNGYGNMVLLEHEVADSTTGLVNYFYTLYGHNESNLVKAGDYIGVDTVIAKAGVTGNASSATGGCLHFEIKQTTQKVTNYAKYLNLAALDPEVVLGKIYICLPILTNASRFLLHQQIQTCLCSQRIGGKRQNSQNLLKRELRQEVLSEARSGMR